MQKKIGDELYLNLDTVTQLLIQFQCGLLPIELSKEECDLLSKEYTSDWFNVLGFDDSYEKPKF
jgi:hypothetical protein